MKRNTVLLAGAAIGAAGIASGLWPRSSAAEEPQTVAPPAEAKAILQKARDYQSWSVFPLYKAEAKFSEGHEKTYVVAWYNEEAAKAVTGDAKEFPVGSIIKATPNLEGVMTADGKPLAGLNVRGGQTCHARAKRDAVFSVPAR